MRVLLLIAIFSLAFVACGGNGGGDSEAFCKKAEDYSGDFNGEDFVQLLEAVKSLRDAAPSDLKGDFDTIIDLTDAVLNDQLDPAQADPAQVEEFGTAVQNIGNYLADECGMEGLADLETPTSVAAKG
ncbi:MAG: hypothetical protein KAZ88_15870 [Acidimicrobiia bacterium]|jgi:hypothetical protein|nr:hypothetical protein [Acidimicrobiia bacterium]MBP8182448.1 hypothetical protein [Acidimicrobiia bacterium]